jgi:membrane-bound metal-dependent hydrolase YbcI (DUF457 family)
MPNCDYHRPVGATVGFGASLALALSAKSPRPGLEAVAGWFGGWVGGALPDIIDPPTSPRHRAIGHGILTACLGLTFSVVKLRHWQTALRQQADADTARAVAEGRWFSFRATVGYILTGFLAGVIAGYLSHLAADAFTPSGLPLF